MDGTKLSGKNRDNHQGGNTAADDLKKKKSGKRRRAIIRASAAVLGLTLGFLGICAAVFARYYSLMDTSETDCDYDNVVSITDSSLAEVSDRDIRLPEEEVYSDRDVTNILLIGTDERTKDFDPYARADSIMILSLDNKTKKIKLVSLERGMLVSIPGRKNDILTHTFRYGGSNLLMETVRTHFKVDVEKYVRVNFSMFQELIDEIGGVDITLTQQEADGLNNYPNSNVGELDRQVFAGVNHFNGYEALQYSRLRSIDDDFHRIERQRKVIIAIKENMTDLSVADLKSIAEDCLPYVQTNLTAIEFADLLIRMPGYFNNEVSQMTIPKKGTYRTLGHVDFKENARILNEFLYVRKNNER